MSIANYLIFAVGRLPSRHWTLSFHEPSRFLLSVSYWICLNHSGGLTLFVFHCGFHFGFGLSHRWVSILWTRPYQTRRLISILSIAVQIYIILFLISLFFVYIAVLIPCVIFLEDQFLQRYLSVLGISHVSDPYFIQCCRLFLFWFVCIICSLAITRN